MIALRVYGVLDEFVTFDRPLDLRRVLFGSVGRDGQIAYTRQSLEVAQARGQDPELIRALKWRLRIGPIREAFLGTGGRLLRRIHSLSRA